MNSFLLSLGLSTYNAKIIQLLFDGSVDTIYMVLLSTAVSILFGVPLGVILLVTSKGYFWENRPFYSVLGTVVNALRSVPFIILMVAIIPIIQKASSCKVYLFRYTLFVII